MQTKAQHAWWILTRNKKHKTWANILQISCRFLNKNDQTENIGWALVEKIAYFVPKCPFQLFEKKRGQQLADF